LIRSPINYNFLLLLSTPHTVQPVVVQIKLRAKLKCIKKKMSAFDSTICLSNRWSTIDGSGVVSADDLPTHCSTCQQQHLRWLARHAGCLTSWPRLFIIIIIVFIDHIRRTSTTATAVCYQPVSWSSQNFNHYSLVIATNRSLVLQKVQGDLIAVSESARRKCFGLSLFLDIIISSCKFASLIFLQPSSFWSIVCVNLI